VNALSYTFKTEQLPVLKDISFALPQGSRTIIVGANGAGKSTLLQILSGKKMTKCDAKVLGQDVFFNTPTGLVYLGTEWASNPVVRSDISVQHFLDSIGGYKHKQRRDILLEILDVDLNWHMHTISDGERRRVQIVSGLMKPWDLLLLDEVTIDLDLLVRSRLLNFLHDETITRNATLIYATHIFDRLSSDLQPTHVIHMRFGSVTEVIQGDGAKQELGSLALEWLKDDRRYRTEMEEKGEPGFIRRGVKGPMEGIELHQTKEGGRIDSETYYRKYDYSH